MANLSQLFIFVLIVGAEVTVAQTLEPEFLRRSITLDGIEYRYRDYVPQN